VISLLPFVSSGLVNEFVLRRGVSRLPAQHLSY
jgi:hypothetical protein